MCAAHEWHVAYAGPHALQVRGIVDDGRLVRTLFHLSVPRLLDLGLNEQGQIVKSRDKLGGMSKGRVGSKQAAQNWAKRYY